MSEPTAESNPLLNDHGLIDYAAVQPAHVAPAISARLSAAEAILQRLEQQHPDQPAALIQELERLGDGLGRSWGVVSHLMSVMNSPELRAAHEAAQPQVVNFWTRVSQSRPIYEALCQARAQCPADDPVMSRILDTEIKDFIHGGVALADEQRQRFAQLRQELAKLSTTFANNHLDSVKAWREVISDPQVVAGIPQRVLAMMANGASDEHPSASAEQGPWVVTLDAPVLLPILQHARDRQLRQRVHQAYATRASTEPHDNRPIIRHILSLRQELAELLGFSSYAEVSLDSKMAPAVSAVDNLLDQLVAAATPHAAADLQAMRALAAADGIDEGDFHSWDTAFYTERLRESRWQLNDEELRAYFPLPRVLAGLFSLLSQLFAVRIVAADGEAPIWHQDVRFFHVQDARGTTIAAFYLDSYARPGQKRSGAWMNSVIARSDHLAGGLCVNGRRIPVAVLVTNAAPPPADGQSLLSFREVETLFHECGHGLQHMLTTVDCSMAAGIAKVEWDAVELPSQFMEQWCYHQPTLASISAHYQSGAALPDALRERLLGARSFNEGMMTLRQCALARLDLRLHHGFVASDDQAALALQEAVNRETLLLPPEPYDAFLCGFGHLFAGGYAAGYYSYKWAEVLAADAWGAFVEAGLDNPQALAEVGQRFRDTVLSLGGSVHPMQVFVAFRGREPNPQALIQLHGLDRQLAPS